MSPIPAVVRHPLCFPDVLARRTDIGWSAKAVYVVVWASLGEDGLCSRPLRQLAAQIGMSERTIRNALAELVEAELLTPIKIPGRSTCWTVGDPGKFCRSTPANIAGVTDRNDTPSPRQDFPGADSESEGKQGVGEDTPANSADPRAPARSLLESNSELESQFPRGSQRERARGAKRAASPCPPDYVPSERTMETARRKRPDLDLDYLAGKFRRYHTEGRGSGQRNSDWDARFLVWVEKEEAPEPGVAAAPGGARAADAAGLRSHTSRYLAALAQGGKP